MTMKTIFRLALLFCLAVAAVAQPMQRTPYTTNTATQRIPAGIFGTFTANTNVYSPVVIGTNTVNGGIVTATTNSSTPIAYIGDGTVTNGLTAGGLTVTTNATVGGTLGVSGAVTMPSVTVTNGASIGGLTVVTNATVGGTLGVSDAVTMPSLTVTNGITAGAGTFSTNVTINGTGGGLTTWTDGAADSTVKMTAGADAASNIYWDWSTTDGTDVSYGKGSGSNIVEFAQIDVDSETQAGGTTMAVTFPTGPQYLRDVILSLTNSMVFTNTSSAASGRSVTYYIFPDATNYTVNVDTDFKIVGGTFTQGVAVTNRYVLTFKSLGTVDTNVWVSGNYVQ